jgi:hypothetical protein
MAVVINEFEVVPSEAPQKQKEGGAEQGGDKKSPPSEHELERLVEHQLSRGERIWAH